MTWSIQMDSTVTVFTSTDVELCFLKVSVESQVD